MKRLLRAVASIFQCVANSRLGYLIPSGLMTAAFVGGLIWNANGNDWLQLVGLIAVAVVAMGYTTLPVASWASELYFPMVPTAAVFLFDIFHGPAGRFPGAKLTWLCLAALLCLIFVQQGLRTEGTTAYPLVRRPLLARFCFTVLLALIATTAICLMVYHTSSALETMAIIDAALAIIFFLSGGYLQREYNQALPRRADAQTT